LPAFTASKRLRCVVIVLYSALFPRKTVAFVCDEKQHGIFRRMPYVFPLSDFSVKKLRCLLIQWDIIVILAVPLVFYRGVRLMKLFFIPPVLVLAAMLLTAVLCASDALASELVGLREIPTDAVPYSVLRTVPHSVLSTVPHAVARPPEMPISLPEPLVPMPFLPIQDRPPIEAVTVEETTKETGTVWRQLEMDGLAEVLDTPAPVVPPSSIQNRQPPPAIEAITTTDVVRGQLGTMDGLAGILDTPPPLARGPVEANTIDPKLLDDPALSDSDFNILVGPSVPGNPVQPGTSGTTPTDAPLGNGVLVIATILTTLGLMYMAFMAYEYRQRWMHSMTMHNDRYIGDRYISGGSFDMDTEDMYGGSASFSGSLGFSDGFGLKRYSL